MLIFTFLGALIIGLSLGLLGAGGSIVTTPLLVYVVGEPVKQAIAESLLIVGLISCYGSLLQYRKGAIEFSNALRFLPTCMVGTLLGSQLGNLVAPHVQLITFAIVAMTSSYLMLFPKQYTSGKGNSNILYVSGVGVGTLAGFVGVGGGFLIVPALIILLGMTPKSATSTSILIIAIQSLFGFASYQFSFTQQGISINWNVVVIVTLFGLGGIQLGHHLAAKINQAQLRRLFGYCLCALSAFIVIRHFL